MNPVIFKIEQFIASTNEIFEINRNAILDSYPPYSIDLYNYYERQATPPVIPQFVPRTPSILIEPAIKYNFTKINIPDTKEYDFINGTNKCDIFNTSLDYDLDLENITNNSITINYDLNNFIDPYSPAISGVWRPALLYIDPYDSSQKNTAVTSSASSKDNPYEAGLCLENFITIQNPVLKSWELSPNVQFRVDWRIPKTSFVTVATLGVLFWYRHYDINRESGATDVGSAPLVAIETATEKSYSNINLTSDGFNIALSGQHKDIDYTPFQQPIDPRDPAQAYNPLLSRYGTSSQYTLGQKVIIHQDSGTPNEKEIVYEVTDKHWVCLGEKRFIPGVDIYIPDDQVYMNWFSSVDLDDYKNCCGPTQSDSSDSAAPSGPDKPSPAKTQYATFSTVNQNKDRYRNIVNSLLSLTDDNILEKIYTGKKPYADIDGGNNTFNGINKYLALKNLAKLLANSPIQEGVSVFAYSAKEYLDEILSFLDFRPTGSNVSSALRDKIKDIYGRLVASSRPDLVYMTTNGNQDSEIANNSNLKLYYGTDASVITADSAQILDTKTKSILYSASATTEHKAFNSLNLVHSKKDLLKSLIRFKQNRYLIFPENAESYITSKFLITKPHLYFNLDFEDQKKINTVRNLWYKQKIRAMGLEVYTKLKLPDDSEFTGNENESFQLSYYDSNGVEKYKTNIPLLSFLDTDTRNGYYNQALGSLYNEYGITGKFNQKIYTERALLSNRSLGGEYFDLGKGLRVTKDRYFMENQTFNNALKTFAFSLDELLEKNDNAKKTKAFLDDRFRDINVPFQSIYPNLKKFYLHRLGGMYLEDITLYTIGKSEWFNFKSGPVPITNSQYFLDKSITSELALRVQDTNKIKITFNCSQDLSIKMYGITIEKLRDEKYELATCRPFPNKVPYRSDAIYVYDKVLGYQFNEYNHILSTQFSPPIVAYGGHREETIEALGVNIFDHPRPIVSGSASTVLNEIPIYDVKNINILPVAAKNSHYSYANETDQKNELGLDTAGAGNWRNDLSAVKCFLTPQNFTNEVTFRKGFFHPNKGWLDHTLLTDPKYINKTAVLYLEDKPCEEFLGYGNGIIEASMTRYEDKAVKKCKGSGKKYTAGDEKLVVREPLMIFDKPERENLQQPNFMTVKMDSAVRNFDFITHLSVRLYDFFHEYPKEIKAALFDPLFYRWMSWGIVDTQIARIIAMLKCMPEPDQNQIEKYEKNRVKEKNNLLGIWQYRARTLARYFLSKSTMLNYEDGFDIKFSSYGDKTAKYANKFDTVIPVQSMDYFIGASGILTGFWEYAEVSSGSSGGSFDPDAPPDPNATPPTGNDTGEYESTWGIHVSDMGISDSGATCFSLQACTGCPIPNYSNSDPYSLFAYNNEAFNLPYRSGYNFIANFRNKLHLLPPVNIEAPLSVYDNREFTDVNGFSLSCVSQPDTIRPREFPKPSPPPEPVFIPPPYPSIVGLLSHISIMGSLMSQGYNPVYGALGGVWVKDSDLMSWFDPSLGNKPYVNAFDVSTAGLTRNERIRRNFANKGFIQIEGNTAEALKLNSGMTGITSDSSPLASLISSQQTLNINKKYPEGRPSKVLLEVQYNNCLWYNIEADIFRYSPRSSPVLRNTKFHYIKHNEHMSRPSNEPYQTDKLYDQLSYPGLLLHLKYFNPNQPNTIYIDGARAYYALKANEGIKIKYRVIQKPATNTGATTCIQVPVAMTSQNRSTSSNIQKVEIIYVDNPMYVPAFVSNDPNNPDDLSDIQEEADNILGGDSMSYSSNPKIEYGDNQKFIKYPITKITLSTPLNINATTENFIEGYIIKNQTNSFLLFDNNLSNGIVYTRNAACETNEMQLTDTSVSINTSPTGCLYIHYQNMQDLIKSGRWFDIKDRHTESSISPYIYDQVYSEGGLGWGSRKMKPKDLGVSPPSELISLKDFDYHFGVNNFCGLIKFTKGYIDDDAHKKISRIKFEPRIINTGMLAHPYAQKTEDQNGSPVQSASLPADLSNFISYTGYPKPLDNVHNKIFAHNIFSISENYHSIYDNIFGTDKRDKFMFNKDLKKYYLPYYDITLDTNLLDTELLDNSVPVEGSYSAASGWIELENIMEINKRVVYDENYYWISIPASASGILSPSSKIPKAIIQKCSHLGGSYSASFCSNVCNNSMVGPSWPNKMDDPNPENLSSDSLVYQFDSSATSLKCPNTVYETRTTEQSFYMGCGEGGEQDNTRVDVTQVYEVPSAASTFISAKDLFENSNEIKVKFQYFPKKIPTDFTFSLGRNVVNQSQLYFWECHKTNKRNVYNGTTRSQTPPFYQILNEMIFRAWFGERQKISISDTFDRDIYLSQNHYQWIPYDYDDTQIFDRERR